MWFKVLGPLEARSGEMPEDRLVELRTTMLRRLLAVLLTAPGRMVPSESLIDALWPENPPDNAVKTLQVYVYRLRRELGDADLVEHCPGGYLLAVAPEQVDGHRFTDLVRRAEKVRSEGALVEAYDLLEQAMGLWSGAPYADLPGFEAVQAEVQRLNELRIRVLEAWAELLLERGGHADILPELSSWVTAHPYRERLVGLQMLALYRSGRQTDALDLFRRTRELLLDELGVEPGPDLQRLHEQMLRREPELDPPPAPDTEPDVPPAQLPSALVSFTGREREVRLLMDAAQPSGQACVPIVVDGMAGVGKTALVIEVAHRSADRFPDGQIYVDLHGFTAGIAPGAPGRVLDRLLRAIGVPGHRIPYDIDDRSALWRTRLQNRRMLIVLDNAASEEQVRPLLPGVPTCLVLVTSRRRLSGLDNLRAYSLGSLPEPDALHLFTQVAGQAADGDPDELSQVAELCGYLPLAIRLAAARLRSRSTWRVTDLLGRLRAEHGRLDELAVGERSVQGAFEISYRQLGAEPQRVFRLLGLHPGSEFDAYATAALADIGLDKAERVLEDLVDLNLLESRGYGRYAFHDLLRAHAAEHAESDETPQTRPAAVGHLADYYVHVAGRAAETAFGASDRMPEIQPIRAPSPVFGTAADALSWLNDERFTLVELARAAGDWTTAHAAALSAYMYRYLFNGVYSADAKVVHEAAVRAGRKRRDRTEEGLGLNRIGATYAERGDYDECERYFRAALVCVTETGDREAEFSIRDNLAIIYRYQGRYIDALEMSWESAQSSWAGTGRRNDLYALLTRATALHYLGAQAEAIDIAQVIIADARRNDNVTLICDALQVLGIARNAVGEYAEALNALKEAADGYRALGAGWGVCIVEAHAGTAIRCLGRPAEALEVQRAALEQARTVGFPMGVCEALLCLGATLRATGRSDEALGRYLEALDVATSLRQPSDQAPAHEGTGMALLDLGRQGPAREQLEQALEIYTRLSMPDRSRVAGTIATL